MNSQKATEDLDAILRERRLAREDIEIQLEAAKASMAKGYYAVARVELRGAIMLLEAMERREEGETT